MAGIKGTGFPGVLPTGGTGFIDMGALQSGSGSPSGIKKAGFPGVLPTGGTGYLNIGTLQSLGSSPQNVTPSAAIPTGEHWGTPVVAGPIKLSAAIPTGEHWFALSVSQFQQIGFIGIAIQTSELWGHPDVAGPISLGAAIPSGEQWFTPAVLEQQTISPSVHIPSGEAWFSPTIFQLAITPTKIPSGEHWGTPIVSEGQFINVGQRPAIPSGESWPTPKVTGGDQGLQVFLGGVNLTTLAATSAFSPQGAGSNKQASTITSQAIGRSTCTIDYVDIGGLLVPGEFTAAQDLCGVTLKIVENGMTLFAGCIDTVGVDREQPFSTPKCIVYHLTVLDKTSICDHRVVTGKVYPAGSDIGQVILDVVANFLNGEFITTQGVPTDGSLGVLDSATSGQYETVRQVFDELATDSGTVWWIDPYGVLYFSPVASAPAAPFGVDETDSNSPIRTSQGTPMIQNAVSGGSQTSGFRNKEYVVSNLNVLPGSGTGGSGGSGGGTVETFTFTLGQPGIWEDPPGTAYGVLTSLPIQQVLSMTVNGNVQTVFELSSFSGQTSTGPNDFLWAFLAGDSQLGPTFGPIPTGATIVVTYVPGNGTNSASVVVGTASNPLTPTGPTFGHCGSGIFEVIDQVKNVSNIDDLNALAQSFLNRSGAIPQILTFETDKPGLFVGQSINVYLPSLGVPRTGTTHVKMIITQISGTAQDWYLAYKSFYRWTVTAVNNYDPANWITYYSRLVARTENALPVLQYETCTLVTGGGVALTGGVGVANPYSVQRTGAFVDIRIAASLPPVNQTLVVQLARNGLVIATVVLAPGATPNVFTVTVAPAGGALYLFAGDVLTWNVNYSPSGGIPVKASGVTVIARWSM